MLFFYRKHLKPHFKNLEAHQKCELANSVKFTSPHVSRPDTSLGDVLEFSNSVKSTPIEVEDGHIEKKKNIFLTLFLLCKLVQKSLENAKSLFLSCNLVGVLYTCQKVDGIAPHACYRYTELASTSFISYFYPYVKLQY